MTDLKPCPFCGGEAECHQWWSATISGDYATFCTECGCGTDYYKTEAEAIAAWDTRADYHGYEQAAIEAWESIKAWNARAERTCKNVCKEWEKTSFAHAATSFCCSECGAHYVDCESYYAGLADADGEQIRTNFCPNCGSRVIG